MIVAVLLAFNPASSAAQVGQMIPSAVPSAPPSGESALVRKIFGTSEGRELLPADDAFKVVARATGPETIQVQFMPAPGYYLYRDKFAIATSDPGETLTLRVEWPRGQVKNDAFFGETEVFDHQVAAMVYLERAQARRSHVALLVEYQGCNYVVGVCYPPAQKRIEIDLPAPRANRSPG